MVWRHGCWSQDGPDLPVKWSNTDDRWIRSICIFLPICSAFCELTFYFMVWTGNCSASIAFNSTQTSTIHSLPFFELSYRIFFTQPRNLKLQENISNKFFNKALWEMFLLYILIKSLIIVGKWRFPIKIFGKFIKLEKTDIIEIL